MPSVTKPKTPPLPQRNVTLHFSVPVELADLIERHRSYIPRNSWIILSMVEKLQREGNLPQENIMEP